MIFLLFLVCLLAQGAFSSENITHRYTIGFLYESHTARNLIEAATVAASSNNFQLHFEGLHVESDKAFQCLNSTCYFILRYPTMGIFGPTSRINVDTIQSICSVRNIPHVLTHYVGQLQGETQLNFYPNIELLTNAYIDILSSMKWEQFTFLYTSEGHTSWVKFVEKAQSRGFDFDIEYINLDLSEKEIDIFEKLRNTHKKYFVIDCLEDDTMQILSILQNYGMINKDYHYFFTSIDTFNESISTFKSSGVDITKIQLLNSNAQANFKAANFSDLPTISEALTFDAVQMFAQALKDLKSTQNGSVNCENGAPWKQGTLFLNYILSISYMGLTGQISFGADRYRNIFDLFIYKLMPDGMTQVGNWNKLNGVEYIKPSYEEPIPHDWRSRPLVVATSLKEPYVMEKQTLHPLQGNDRYLGFAIDLMDELSKIEHFTYEIVVVEGGAGSRGVSGNWTGILGEILMENADLGILDITITSDRLHAVEFTHPVMHTGITILFQKPKAMPPRLYNFMRPFSTGLWISIALSFLAVTISLFIVGRICNSEWQKLNPTSNFNTSQLTFPNTIWFVAGSLFRQNTQVKIRSIPGRIIAAAWWLLCFVMLAMYIAALVTHRMENEDDKDILFSDVKSLVKNAKERGISYGALKHSATLEFFKTARTPLYQELYQQIIENDDLVVSTDDAVKRAEMTKYAFFTEKATIDYITRHHCTLTQYDGLLNENSHGIAMRPNSPYLPSLNKAILKLSNTGKLDELKRRWWGNQGMCDEKEVDGAYPLYIVDIIGLIQVTLIGIAVAVISAIVEFLVYVDKKSKKLKIAFLKVFKLEVKKCFSGNTKTAVERNLIIKPVPENEEHETTEAIEL